jgi:hypothetical protein
MIDGEASVKESKSVQILNESFKKVDQELVSQNKNSLKESVVEMSYRDISLRLHTKDEFYMFFYHINQRLLPKISSLNAENFRQLLTGEKKALRLLDSRDYYFPKAFFTHELLSVNNLCRLCTNNYEISKFIFSGCDDPEYFVKLLATFDRNKLIEIDYLIRSSFKDKESYIYLN